MISALVVTVDPARLPEVVGRLSLDPRLTLGEAVAGRLPVVLDLPGADACEDAVRELSASPGVTFVDVVLVDAQDEDLGPPGPAEDESEEH